MNTRTFSPLIIDYMPGKKKHVAFLSLGWTYLLFFFFFCVYTMLTRHRVTFVDALNNIWPCFNIRNITDELLSVTCWCLCCRASGDSSALRCSTWAPASGVIPPAAARSETGTGTSQQRRCDPGSPGTKLWTQCAARATHTVSASSQQSAITLMWFEY